MRYPAYKDFNAPRWPGTDSAPADWEVRRLKFAATCNDEALPENTDPDYEIAYVDISSVDLVNGITTMETLPFEEAPSRARRIVRDGDTIVSTVRTYLKAIAAIEEPPNNLIVSTGFAVVRPLEFVDSRFLGYALQGTGFIDSVVANSTGVSYPAINPTMLVCLPVGYPEDKNEQRQIAAFLDWKTGQIDALIARKQELLEKLKEKRIAVITQGVTQGLNSAAPMHDSGIPWLGQVPQHWDVLKMSWVCTSIRDGTHNPPERAPGIHRLLSVRNVQDGGFSLLDDDRTMTPEDFAELQRSYTVEENDVVLAIVGATTGKSAIVGKFENVTVQRSLAILRPDRDAVSSSFLHYVIQSPIVQTEIALTVFKYSAQPGIYLDDVGRLPVVKPPYEEQVDIAAWLDAETAKLDALAQRVESAIDRLTEYRTALITAATTGKIDVRNVKVPTSAD